MKKRIQVFIGEAAIDAGELNFEIQGNRTLCAFAYSPGWLRRPDRFNLSPDLQLVDRDIGEVAPAFQHPEL